MAIIDSKNPVSLHDGIHNLNMNDAYLNLISLFMITYSEARFSHDYEKMQIALALMEKTLSPKVDNDDTETKLKTLTNLLPRMLTRNDMGTVICYNPEHISTFTELADEIYALLLIKMESKRMLTYRGTPAQDAMGNFSGG